METVIEQKHNNDEIESLEKNRPQRPLTAAQRTPKNNACTAWIQRTSLIIMTM
jgi:hypothetical protein